MFEPASAPCFERRSGIRPRSWRDRWGNRSPSPSLALGPRPRQSATGNKRGRASRFSADPTPRLVLCGGYRESEPPNGVYHLIRKEGNPVKNPGNRPEAGHRESEPPSHTSLASHTVRHSVASALRGRVLSC